MTPLPSVRIPRLAPLGLALVAVALVPKTSGQTEHLTPAHAAFAAADQPATQDGAEIAPTPSRITEVVAFPNHAEVTRKVTVQAIAGENQVWISDLVPGLNPHSLRASCAEGGRITGTEIKTVYLKGSTTEEIAALDLALQQLDDALQLKAMAEARSKEQAAFYSSIKGRLAKDMEAGFALGDVSVADWGEVLGFVDQGLTGTDQSLAALALEVRSLKGQRELVAAKRKDYAGRQPKEMREVTVSFAAERAGPLDVAIHYMVDAVMWKPSYDVHLDREDNTIGIIGYGQVVQWTGENWDDVELTLAMSRPDFELAVPELQPLVASLDKAAMDKLVKEVTYLSRTAQDQATKWAESRFARPQERETFRRNLEQLARHSREQLQAYGLSHELIDGALSRLVDRFAAVRYDVPRRVTIPMDSSPHKVVAFDAVVPVALLRYVATPALGDTVMLQGSVVNTTGHPVLEGSVALFVDGSFVGSSSAEGAAENEVMFFNFGPDDALVVSRRLVSRTVKGPEVFRQSQVLTYRYAIELENFNDQPVEVDVSDQVPISKTEDIQVTFLSSSHPQELHPETGALFWTLEVAAGERAQVEYTFSVECPVGHDVHWQ
jgi:uncharacterized protein (TIGR02231 family)